ncbi:hypothetical protein JCM18916_1865 [Cutibacterium acnes JCM 18916]|nr:hypothetical protein JCM18916_1865 [Cutibacterium acnes JCM 18916]
MTSTVDDVLAAVEALPAGAVVSYSDVAELVARRRVGSARSWRVKARKWTGGG